MIDEELLAAARRITTISAYTVSLSRCPTATRAAVAWLKVLLSDPDVESRDLHDAYDEVCVCLGRKFADG